MIGFHEWSSPTLNYATNPTLRQLTSSAAENFIEYACISPDGKYVAYLEKAGNVYLSSIDTGETRVLMSASGRIPSVLVAERCTAPGHEMDGKTLWKISTLTGKISKLKDNAAARRLLPMANKSFT